MFNYLGIAAFGFGSVIMVTFRISSVSRSYSDGLEFSDPYLNSIANIEADFELIIDQKVIISEHQWNIVEFADQLIKWRKSYLIEPFVYHCMDSEEEILFTLIPKDGDFQLISVCLKSEKVILISDSDLNEFIRNYPEKVIQMVKENFEIDLRLVKELSFIETNLRSSN